MKTKLFIIASLSYFAFSCGQSASDIQNQMNEQNSTGQYSTPKVKTHEELMEDAKTLELQNPQDYLSVKYNLDYKVFSGKDVVKGTITSSAISASYKDIKLKISFSSKTESNLGSEEYVIYEYVNPGSSLPFEIKLKSPRGTSTIGVTVLSAKSAN